MRLKRLAAVPKAVAEDIDSNTSETILSPQQQLAISQVNLRASGIC